MSRAIDGFQPRRNECDRRRAFPIGGSRRVARRGQPFVGQRRSASRISGSSAASDPTWDQASSTAARAIDGFHPRPTSASRACARTIVASSLALAWDGGSLRRRVASWPDAVVVIASVPRWSARWQAEHYAGCVVMPGSGGPSGDDEGFLPGIITGRSGRSAARHLGETCLWPRGTAPFGSARALS